MTRRQAVHQTDAYHLCQLSSPPHGHPGGPRRRSTPLLAAVARTPSVYRERLGPGGNTPTPTRSTVTPAPAGPSAPRLTAAASATRTAPASLRLPRRTPLWDSRGRTTRTSRGLPASPLRPADEHYQPREGKTVRRGIQIGATNFAFLQSPRGPSPDAWAQRVYEDFFPTSPAPPPPRGALARRRTPPAAVTEFHVLLPRGR